jgi:hypothetical protein
MRSLATMALLVVFTMKFTREGLSTITTRVSYVCAFGNGRFERLGKIAHIWMEGSFVVPEVLLVRKAFLAEAIPHFALKWTIVDVDMSFARFFVRKPLGEISARDLRAFEQSLVVVEFTV